MSPHAARTTRVASNNERLLWPATRRSFGWQLAHRPSAVVGVLAGATLVLGGCTTTAVPTGPIPPSPSPTSITSPSVQPSLVAAVGTPEPGDDNDFVDGANGSDAAESPTFTATELSNQVENATKGYVAAWLTRGYPNKNDKALLRRVEQLTTAQGFAEQSRVNDGGKRAAAELYARHERTRPDVDSIGPTLLTSDEAICKVEYRLVTQRRRNGSWRTVATSQLQRQTLKLVDTPGSGWLVDSVS